jgi:hypothetical protein
MVLTLSEAAFTSCSAVWPVLTTGSLSALLALFSELMVIVEYHWSQYCHLIEMTNSNWCYVVLFLCYILDVFFA